MNTFPHFRWRFTVGVALLSTMLFVQQLQARPYVIGYIPAYKDLRVIVDATDLLQLTHINLAFLNPNTQGEFANNDEPVCMGDASAADIDYVVQQAHQAGVKVLVALAGAVVPDCGGDWSKLLRADKRAAVVKGLVKFVERHQLDGIDVDIEGALLTKIDQAGDYTAFVAALREALDGKLLTAATASYEGGMIPVSSLVYFDFVTLMAYDAIGPGWGTPGSEHARYEDAEAHMELWDARGLPKEKRVLGLPFYGYGFGDYASEYYSFSDLVTQFGHHVAEADLIGEPCAECDYITYNGVPTIQRKTALGLEQGAGVMIWELSQDTGGDLSLLKVVDNVINSNSSQKASIAP